MTTSTNAHTKDTTRNPVFVSDVIGEGEDAHRLASVGPWRFVVPGVDGNDPLVRDLDAAERLGFARPRKVRELIERIWPEDARPIQRPAVGRRIVRGGGVQEYRVDEYWLTEAELLKLCARSETPVAEAILDEMIAVFVAVRRGLLVRAVPAVPPQLEEELAALRAQIAASRLAIVELQQALASGVIGPEVAEQEILVPLRRIAHLRGATSRERRSWRSRVERLLRNLLGHACRGATWARLDRRLLGVARHQVGLWLDEAIASARRCPPGQLSLGAELTPRSN